MASTDSELRAALLEVVAPIVERSKGVIGTHSASCYEYHVACLAVLVRDLASSAFLSAPSKEK